MSQKTQTREIPEKILEKVDKIIEDLRQSTWYCHGNGCVKLFKIYGVTVTAYIENGEYVVSVYMDSYTTINIILDENGNVKRLVV